MNWKSLLPSLTLKVRKTLLNPRVIRRMRHGGGPCLGLLGEALHGHLGGKLTDTELHWIEAIEKVRAGMCSSTKVITGPDYGAGLPADTVSAKGKAVTESVGDACRSYSKPRTWATLLFHLVRKFRPVVCVELGTCLGVSAAYQAAALELNGEGRLLTLEGSPAFAEIASFNLETLRLAHRAQVVVGRFQNTLNAVLEDVANVDYAFIDGHHDEHATLQYLEQFLPHLSSRAVLVFDDIAWSQGMRRAWARIRDDQRVDVSLDCSVLGICLLGAGVKGRYNLKMH